MLHLAYMKVAQTIRILGIDPGYGRIGWGVIEGKKDQWSHVAHGCIETNKQHSFVDRLLEIQDDLNYVIQKYQPVHCGVEELFFSKNVTTGVKVGQARGVILLTAHNAGLSLDEVKPVEVKQALTGYGGATKAQIQMMVSMQLGLKKRRFQDDAADALAVALTVGTQMRIQKNVKKSMRQKTKNVIS